MWRLCIFEIVVHQHQWSRVSIILGGWRTEEEEEGVRNSVSYRGSLVGCRTPNQVFLFKLGWLRAIGSGVAGVAQVAPLLAVHKPLAMHIHVHSAIISSSLPSGIAGSKKHSGPCLWPPLRGQVVPDGRHLCKLCNDVTEATPYLLFPSHCHTQGCPTSNLLPMALWLILTVRYQDQGRPQHVSTVCTCIPLKFSPQ